tara:strand:+ start:3264 stop:3653 length:390 start_codon:yes stop_codon:yes gene_type:complete
MIKNYIIASIILIILDFIWIKFYMGKKYNVLINKIQNNPMNPKFIYVLFAYLLMLVGLNMFVIQNIRKSNRLIDSIKYGFLFGIVVYGIYDMTCAALFNDWDIKLAIIDTIWGGFVFFISAYIGSFFMK